jgi:glycosyltransferase involved in cell wall biosynthesis
LPSIHDRRNDTEGLGVVLLEAMSYGVPVIGSAVGGIPDIIVDGETGLLVPPHDSAALAGALERLAHDSVLAARLGLAGYRHVRSNFSWDRIVTEWEECYAAATQR